jgi:UDP-N-acetylglucosamine enolpyruvyl transferase
MRGKGAAALIVMGTVLTLAPLVSDHFRQRLVAAPIQGAGIRETASLLLASLIAEGTSVIREAQALFRGYEDLPRDLTSMGAVVTTTTWNTPPRTVRGQARS